jgi:hypothetical protein
LILKLILVTDEGRSACVVDLVKGEAEMGVGEISAESAMTIARKQLDKLLPSEGKNDSADSTK